MSSVILTRSDDDNASIAHELASRGYEVWSAPMIELRPIEHERGELERIAPLVDGSLIIITSAHAARGWLELREAVFAGVTPAAYAVVGSTSEALLAEHEPAIPVVATASTATELATKLSGDFARAVYPCSSARRPVVIDALQALGVEVVELPLYEPALPADASQRMADALARSTPPRSILFHSPSAVANWFSLRSDIPPDSIFVAIGPTTAASLRAHGVSEALTSTGTDGASLAEAVERSLGGGA